MEINRDNVLKNVVDKFNINNIVCELATGFGKTKIAIESINSMENSDAINLIVVPKKANIEEWKKEIAKWGGLYGCTTFICYASLKKYVHHKIDNLILDECHHINSNITINALSEIKSTNPNLHMLGLSATIGYNTKKSFNSIFKGKDRIEYIKVSTQQAIDNGVLPDPEIILIPIKLDNTIKSEYYEINKGMKKFGTVHDDISNIWTYKKNRKHALLKCTQLQKNNQYDNDINYLKNSNNAMYKNILMQQCNNRLKFLSNIKTDKVKELLKILKDRRVLTFCNSIEQADKLEKNSIHSKNDKSKEILDKFNSKKIKHISACNILNEGINLTDCKYGIFANIMASDTIQVQRIGRLLRHKEPVLIIPFYKDTREQEIVLKWMNGYNKNLIKIMSFDELKKNI